MADEQRAAIAAYVFAYIQFERTNQFTHSQAERRDLDTDVEITESRALALGVTIEALREAVALAPWPGHMAK